MSSENRKYQESFYSKDDTTGGISGEAEEGPFDKTVFGGKQTPEKDASFVARDNVEWFPVMILLRGNEPKKRYVLMKPKNLIGRDPRMDLHVNNDSMVSRMHAEIRWENYQNSTEYPRCFLNDLDSSNGTFLNRKPLRDQRELNDGDRISIGATVFGFYIKDNHELEYDENLQSMATIDSLTGLVNRRAFLEEAHRTISRALRYEYPLCLTLIDIDDFKQINDQYGHGAGDMVLRRLAAIMKNSLRDGDIIGRMGGDEFAVLMPETQIREAASALERLRTSVIDESLYPEGHRVKLSISVGVSSLCEKINKWSFLYRAADASLYKAKSLGRNRICISRPAE